MRDSEQYVAWADLPGQGAHAFVCDREHDEEVEMGTPEDVRQLVAPIVTAAGLELWDVEVGGGVVRILVDRPEGVDLDGLAGISRTLSRALDDHDDLVSGGRYQLEVSSPGVERTLRTPEQFRRFVGSELSVKLRSSVDGARRLHGALVDADADAVRLRVDGSEVPLPYDQIERARTMLVWGPAGPGGRKQGDAPLRSMTAARSSAAPKPKDAS